jgi:hypothetical protein
MTPQEAANFYEADEDPRKVFAAFDAAEKGLTAPPVAVHLAGPSILAAPASRTASLRVKIGSLAAAPVRVAAMARA